jgi:hypothetical protein
MMMNNYKQMGLADSTVKMIEDDLKKQESQVKKPENTTKE